MENNSIFMKRLSLVGWGLLLIWWGLRWSVLITLPEGSGLLGTALILFGANVARILARIPANPNNTFFGLFSLISGGILFAFDVLQLSVKLPVFETMLIVLGILLVGYAAYSSTRQKASEA